MGLPIEILSYEDIRERCVRFLRQYNPNDSIPVPIEQIVEFSFGINIIPILEFQRLYDVDAFLSSDLKSLVVDQGVLQSRSPNRYRFSLAHELAHAVLHREIYAQFQFANVEKWKAQLASISDEDLDWLEFQANSFAGLALVPRDPLREKFEEAVRFARGRGVSFDKVPDRAKGYTSTWIGKFFEVSSQVVEKRLDKDGLWPP